MSDYKEMYYKLFKASQEAIEIIVAAQKECEEIYTAGEPPAKRVVPFPAEMTQDDEAE